MFIFVLSLHFLLCFILICLVLIQQGKGADMGAAFGAGGSNSLFGAGGATSLIVRVTTITAILFMVTSVALIKLSGTDTGLGAFSGSATAPSLADSVMKDVQPSKPEVAAATSAGAVSSNGTVAVEAEKNSDAAKSAAADSQSVPVTTELKDDKDTTSATQDSAPPADEKAVESKPVEESEKK